MKNIRIGIGVGDIAPRADGLEGLLADFRQAEEAGFQTAWIPNIFGMDALTLAALAARETSRLELGTAVVPTHSRHPYYMAQQAVSTQAAAGGRFVLGVGPSHKVVIEDLLGLSYARPARHVREYVTIVKELMDAGKTGFEGELYRVNASLSVSGGATCPVLIGALGPQMRRVAGEVADGTITWMTGPRTLGESIVPDLAAATQAAGRPASRVVAGFPVALTNDAAATREKAGQMFAMYGTLPSYRAMLDEEGAAGPGDVAVVGDETELEAQIARLASAGVTDFHAAPFPDGSDDSVKRTTAFLADLARR